MIALVIAKRAQLISMMRAIIAKRSRLTAKTKNLSAKTELDIAMIPTGIAMTGGIISKTGLFIAVAKLVISMTAAVITVPCPSNVRYSFGVCLETMRLKGEAAREQANHGRPEQCLGAGDALFFQGGKTLGKARQRHPSRSR